MSEHSYDNVYEANETMKLLGHQYYGVAYDPEVRKQMDDIVDARRFTTTFNTALDMFMLGFMHGKMADRARRKKKHGTNSRQCSAIMES